MGVDIARERRKHGGKGGDIVVRIGLGDGRVAVGVALEVEPAGEGLAYHVIARAVAHAGDTAELLVAHAADVDDDQLRVHLQQLLVIDAQFLQPDHVLHEDVGFLDETVEYLLYLVELEVQLQGHGQLVAGVLRPGCGNLFAVDLGERRQHTERVAHAGAFYLDDLGAEIGQHGGGKGHCYQRAGAHYAHAGKGTVLGDYKLAFTHYWHSFLLYFAFLRSISAIISGMSLR